MASKRPLFSPTRFETLFRGKLVEVEMTIFSLDPPEFRVIFDCEQPDPPPTRGELAQLCREASEVTRVRH